MFTALAGRTVYVQAVEGPELAEKAKAERTVTWVNRAPRGDITGRDGTVLASSAVSYDVGVNQSAIAQYERTEMRLNESTGANEKVVVDYGATAVAAQLAPILNVDPLELGAKLVGNRSYEVIAQEVSPDTWRKIKALDIPGVEPDQRTRRTYPAGTVAGNVLGFTHEGEHNRELIGAAGLELTQNKVLTGTDGKGSEEVGRSGVIIPTGEQEDEPARPGSTVRTTLNPDLQSIAQETIDKTVAAQHADWGIVMAMEPATGKVVVLADSNSVDPSDPAATAEENRTARSVQAVFEPGSVGKVVTFATALEEGVVKPEDTWTVPYTWTSANGQTFKDSHEHETQTMTTAGVLAESSNVGTVQIGEKLADDVRYKYMKRKETPQKRPEEVRVISEATAKTLTEMLIGVTQEGGTAESASINGYLVAGKTGTTEILSDDSTVASFVGFLPARDPVLAIAVIVNRPEGIYGGTVAAPVFREVALAAMQALNIAPDPSVVAAQAARNGAGGERDANQ